MTPDWSLLSTIAQVVAGQPAPLDELPAGDARAALVAATLAQGVGPILLWALERQGVDISDPAWSPLVVSTRQVAIQHVLAAATQQQVDAALSQAGIPAIWFKGADLARTVYAKPSLRPMGDIDLLVPYPLRQQALAVVESLGYRLEAGELFQGAHELIHHYHLRGNVAGAVRLELHFRLLGYSDRLLPLEQLSWFWQHTRPWSDGDVSYTFLQPEAHLLYLCAHAVLQHGEADFRLLRYLDLHQLLTHSPTFDWDVVVDQAVALGWTYAVERALSITRHFFATPLPDDLLESLRRRRPADEDVTAVTDRQARGTRWEGIQVHFATMSWPARARLAWRLAVPPTAYMRWRYDVQADWQVPLAYLYRWADVAGEIGKTVGKRIKTRRKAPHPQETTRTDTS